MLWFKSACVLAWELGYFYYKTVEQALLRFKSDFKMKSYYTVYKLESIFIRLLKCFNGQHEICNL
jgi:hypothetical protein